MALDINDIQRISTLARLHINDSEAQLTLHKLTGIMDLIEQMQAVDTSNISPMSHAQDLEQRLREDVVTASNLRERFQAVAPATQDGLYLVPRVVE